MKRPHDDAMLELAALRAIDALEPDEAAEIDRHIAECSICAEECKRGATVAAAMAVGVRSQPPAALRQRVLSSAVKIRRIVPWYRRPAIATTAAAAAIVIAAGSWLVYERDEPIGSPVAAACQAPISGCGGEVIRTAALTRLNARGLPPLAPGKVYQAWIIHPHQAPVPEPTFLVSRDGDGDVEMPTSAAGDIVAVTVEPQGGSKAPTSKPVLVATI